MTKYFFVNEKRFLWTTNIFLQLQRPTWVKRCRTCTGRIQATGNQGNGNFCWSILLLVGCFDWLPMIWTVSPPGKLQHSLHLMRWAHWGLICFSTESLSSIILYALRGHFLSCSQQLTILILNCAASHLKSGETLVPAREDSLSWWLKLPTGHCPKTWWNGETSEQLGGVVDSSVEWTPPPPPACELYWRN